GQDFGQVREGRAFAVAAQVEGGEGEGKEDPDRVEIRRDRTADFRELVVRRRRATSRESGRAVKSRPPRGSGRLRTARRFQRALPSFAASPPLARLTCAPTRDNRRRRSGRRNGLRC